MKFTPGPIVAALSGSVGGTVASRNAGGAYFRFRAVPVTSTTEDALAAKGNLTTQSQGWRNLTAEQRTSWSSFALQNPITDVLGQSLVLKGNMIYISINTLLAQSGSAVLSNPPTGAPPAGLTSLTLDADIGAGNVELAFTATPLGANEILVVRAYVTNSVAINYVQNQLRTISFSSLAQASPFDIEAAVIAKFGALVVGQTVHTEVYTLDTTTGLRSSPLKSRDIVTS